MHTIPSGIFRQQLVNVIGNGVVIDPITLEKEINNLITAAVDYKGRLLVARKAHLILPTHRYLDAAKEASKGDQKIGSTLKGIGPTYMDKTGRNGLRVGDIERPNFMERYNSLKEKHVGLLAQYPVIDFDLEAEEAKWFESLETLKSLDFVDGEYYINKAIKAGKKILAEGAQGSMLDIDFGTYPFVTSSNTITAGVCTGLGIAPSQIGEVIGITKAYCTRVGGGPFPTELFDETGEFLRKEGQEFGATTGRPRRCGWIDLPQLRYTIMLNGVTQIALTKIDVLDKLEILSYCNTYQSDGQESEDLPYDLCAFEIDPVYQAHPGWQKNLTEAKEFNDLPVNAKTYIDKLEDLLDTPITMVSTGPERRQLIFKAVEAVA